MSNTFKTNIQVADVQNQINSTGNTQSNNSFDAKNYLDARLGDNEQRKTLTIRLLPFSETNNTPFEKVYMHYVPRQRKSLPCPTHNKLGDKCPFCEINKQAWKNYNELTAMAEKLNKNESLTKEEMEKYPTAVSLKEISKLQEDLKAQAKAANAQENWVCRCIERGKENEGPKFWKFSNSKNSPYAQIMELWNMRYEKKGENIFDLNEGKDLEITIKRGSDGKTTSYYIVCADNQSPLTTDFDLGNAWITDAKKWNDVYKVQPYDKMEVYALGGEPYYDRAQQKFVDKAEYERKKAEQQAVDEAKAAAMVATENERAQKYMEIPTEPMFTKPTETQSKTSTEEDLPF